ncbi:MAG: metallophosphoesterase [Corynebacterium sp.]|uniref:metallophosphoesterase family protein n=1 Tax=Corynebacterium sp. TaxID=1720 RepID=UPI0026DF878D|nr:metallophosphoesterase [Corynebacterium sp.]MDO5669907.1 metallophosphoesterase [Corynebacterium sp.]
MSVRLAVFADLHLGRKKAPGLQWARQALVDAAPDADIIIFTGDLLDKKKATRADLEDSIDLFRFITQDLGKPLVHVWGNHDVGSGFIDEFPAIEGVYRPEGGDIEQLQVPGIPLVFHAVNVIEDPDPRTTLKQLGKVDGPGHIAVLHTEVEGQYTKNPCLPITADFLLSRGYSACLMGHVHSPVVLQEEPWTGWIGMGQMLELEVPALP